MHNNVTLLTHSDVSNVKEVQLLNLYKTYQGIVLVISQCKKLCNLEIESPEVLSVLEKALVSMNES